MQSFLQKREIEKLLWNILLEKSLFQLFLKNW